MRFPFQPRFILCLLGLLLLSLIGVSAEQLPIKTYTTADGLARDRVQRIRRDARGFLWFCTAEGLSRFDGYQFTNFTVDQGLPHRSVWDFLETRDGVYWVATLGGLSRFNPSGSTQPRAGEEPMFTVYRPQGTSLQIFGALCEDRAGNVWWGTKNGLYQVTREDSDWRLNFVDLGVANAVFEIYNILEDRRGALWVATTTGLFRRLPGGRIERFTTQNGLPSNVIRGLLEDTDGAMWIGTSYGLCKLLPEVTLGQPIVARWFNVPEGLPGNWCNWMLRDSGGRLWVGTSDGLGELLPKPDGKGRWFRTYTDQHGLNSRFIWTMVEDRNRNLWLASMVGAMKMARNGFVTWRQEEGLGINQVISIMETKAGEICVTNASAIGRFLSRVDGERLTTIRPFFGRPVDEFGVEPHQKTLQDSAGEWWIPTSQGLFRFPRVASFTQLARTRPKAFYGMLNGMSGDHMYRIYEDRNHDIWIYAQPTGPRLTRWERATGTFHHYTEKDGLPPNEISAFCEDNFGNLWMTSYSGDLLRYANGRFQKFKVATGTYFRLIHSLYHDKSGRLWVGTGENGLLRIDQPNADNIQFIRYTTADGLSSNDIWNIAEDRWGAIWLCTGRGLDRFNPATKQVRYYTTADGLASNVAQALYVDSQGTLWIGTLQGLSRYIPEPDPPAQQPPVFISGLRIAGAPWKVSRMGETEVAGLELAANQNEIQIDFFGLGFSAGESLRYQFKLEGAGQDWSAPINQRSVNFSLAPGTYRFLVRALSAEGTVSQTPAAVSFKILRPIWQRWWFLALTGLLSAGVVYATYRYNLARQVEIERVRTRIATDLHDDIGASLSRMAILSEVVKQQNGANREQAAQMLTEIADSARGLVDSMSDIVWSIDPRRDDLKNVVTRARQFAADVLEPQNIVWQFTAPPEIERVKLGTEQRRHLFLILKEAINNVARHSRCSNVSVKLTMEGHRLIAEIQDDGRGFVCDTPRGPSTGRLSLNRGGNGLKNMRARASELGGELKVDSAPGRGTRLTLMVSLR